MKNTSIAFSLIFIFTFILGCSSDDENAGDIKGNSGVSFNTSYSTWKKLKNEKGESYRYKITTTSWTGWSSITEIEVQNSLVSRRTYQSYQMDGKTGERKLINSYSEISNQIGTHSEGTVDHLYETCLNSYLRVDKSKNTLVFETLMNRFFPLADILRVVV